MSIISIPLTYCTTFKTRFWGFMFQKRIQTALCFPHCNSIHTFFMRSPILVIMTSKDHKIVFQKIVKPWKIIGPVKKAYYTYEFPPSYRSLKTIGENFQP